MDSTELRPCQPVWAPLGSVGWRPAFVLSVGKGGKVRLQFETASQSEGTRHASALRPRNPKLQGTDKPTMDESAVASEAGYAATGSARGYLGKVTRP